MFCADHEQVAACIGRPAQRLRILIRLSDLPAEVTTMMELGHQHGMPVLTESRRRC